jgi:Ca2+/H+ antiporter, TMEM165/GDT1 family
LGTAIGFAIVLIAAIGLGLQLNLIPIRLLRCLAGLVVLYFGFKWVYKGVKRQATGRRAGWVHDPLRGTGMEVSDVSGRFSYGNFIVMLKSAALETFEAALIVMTIGLGSKNWFSPISWCDSCIGLDRYSSFHPAWLFNESAG